VAADCWDEDLTLSVATSHQHQKNIKTFEMAILTLGITSGLVAEQAITE